jgi:hypothetical protein
LKPIRPFSGEETGIDPPVSLPMETALLWRREGANRDIAE